MIIIYRVPNNLICKHATQIDQIGPHICTRYLHQTKCQVFRNSQILELNQDNHHHQLLQAADWRQWVRMNDLHYPLSFVKSIALLNVSPNDLISSFALSIHRSLGLPLFLFPSNLACIALCGIRSIDILSTCPNHYSLCWSTLSSRFVWLPKACLMSSFLIWCSLVTPVIL